MGFQRGISSLMNFNAMLHDDTYGRDDIAVPRQPRSVTGGALSVYISFTNRNAREEFVSAYHIGLDCFRF